MRWIGELVLFLGRVLDSSRLGVVGGLCVCVCGGGGGGGRLSSGVLMSWFSCVSSSGGWNEWASFLGTCGF